jgi:hypothetical protein
MQDTVFLFVLSEFMIGGQMAMVGEIVEVSNSEARDLLARNLVRPATEDDQPAAAPADEDPAPKAKK